MIQSRSGELKQVKYAPHLDKLKLQATEATKKNDPLGRKSYNTMLKFCWLLLRYMGTQIGLEDFTENDKVIFDIMKFERQVLYQEFELM